MLYIFLVFSLICFFIRIWAYEQTTLLGFMFLSFFLILGLFSPFSDEKILVDKYVLRQEKDCSKLFFEGKEYIFSDSPSITALKATPPILLINKRKNRFGLELQPKILAYP